MSNQLFHIGDLVIMQHASYFTEYDGTPAIIIGEFKAREAVNMNSLENVSLPASYRVRLLCAAGMCVTVEPHQIRKPSTSEDSDSINNWREQPVSH